MCDCNGGVKKGKEKKDKEPCEEEKCPLEEKSITGRFAITEVKCGDPVGLEADATNIPDGTQTTFTLKKLPGRENIGPESANLAGSQVRGLNWVSRKPTDLWPEWDVDFDVAADGATGRSENQLKFHRYEDISQTDIIRSFNSETCAAHPACRVYTIEQRVKVELDDRVLKIHVPIKVRKRSTTQPARGPTEAYATWWARCLAVPLDGDGNLTAAEKTTLKNRIEAFFHHKKALHRHLCTDCLHSCSRKCCILEIKVVVHFYDLASGTPASYVEYWRGAGRADAKNWFVTDTAATNAHEVGHLMGFYDEYTGGAVGGAPWQHPNAGRIMCDVSAGLENYYFNAYATWLGDAARTSETWDVVDYR